MVLPEGTVSEPCGARYEYPAKMSIREAGASGAAAAFLAALDEF